MNSYLKNIVRDWVPVAVIRFGYTIIDVMRPAAYEFIGHSWPQGVPLKGWHADGVQKNWQQAWNTFVSSMEENCLLGLSEKDLLFPRYINTDSQSLYLSFGYSLGLACHKKDKIAVLDWGGGTGAYSVVSRKLFPEVTFTYHCADLPSACATGRKLLPDVIFHDTETWKETQFDLVFSSSSLQYLEDWHSTVEALIHSSDRYLYVTRMPFIISGKSFVMIQRAACYETEYLGWVLNRQDFIGFVESRGMKLVRQFVNHTGPRIKNAPEQNLYMGFLFEK